LSGHSKNRVFNPHHSKYYAQSAWPTVHGDSSNSDYVPMETSSTLEKRWHVLKGAALWTAPSTAPDGTIYIASGRGPGFSNFHAIFPDGEIRWQSAPQNDLDDLDSLALISCPVIDIEGDVYIGDSNQFWAFHPDGKVKWVINKTAHGVAGPFITAIIVKGYVGGISSDGKVMLLNRENGDLAVPVLDLPGGPSPEGPADIPGLWEGGLVDPAVKKIVLDILMGFRCEVSNTPAVHPKTQRIYIMASGKTTDEGAFYGIDLDENGLKIAFITPVPPGSGTSPVISYDGTRVFATGGNGEMIAVDAENGKILWNVNINGVQASPSSSPNGILYAHGKDNLIAMNESDGSIKWARSFESLAAEHLPGVDPIEGILPDGRPVAFLDSVTTITKNFIYNSALIGYELHLAGRKLTHPLKTFMLVLDPETGDLIETYPIPDTSEGGISIGMNGDLYMDILALQASLGYYVYNRLLPAELHAPKPVGGLVAFTPEGK
jgi:outer membrane protein assembly factor BamB